MGGDSIWRKRIPAGLKSLLGAVAFAACIVGLATDGRAAGPRYLFRYTERSEPGGPLGDLARGPDGSLYATNMLGGPNGAGEVIRVSPPQAGVGAWIMTRLHAFAEDDGGGREPLAGVALGPHGELYGLASGGGERGRGLAYRLTPPARPGEPWVKDILFRFKARHGLGFSEELHLGRDGALYGVAERGGAAGCGVAFSLTPREDGALPWKYQLLAEFAPETGCSPLSRLIEDGAGNLYGSLSTGGDGTNGAVFQLRRRPNGEYRKVIIASAFGGLNFPRGDLALSPSGELFGTTYFGGFGTCGGVFRLTPPRSGETGWTSSNILELDDIDTRPCRPDGVAMSGDTLALVAFAGGPELDGALVELTPRPSDPDAYDARIRESFNAAYRGPRGAPVFGPRGELYGTTTDRVSVWRSGP